MWENSQKKLDIKIQNYEQTEIAVEGRRYKSESGHLFLLDCIGEHKIHSSKYYDQQNGTYPQGLLLLSFVFHPRLQLRPLIILLSFSLLLDFPPFFLFPSLYFLLLFLPSSYYSLFLPPFLQLSLTHSCLLIRSPDRFYRLPFLIPKTIIIAHNTAKCFQFLSNSLIVPQNSLMQGSISLTILSIEVELSLNRCQQRVIRQFLKQGNHTITLIGLHCQNQGRIFLVILDSIVDSLLHQNMKVV